MAVEAMQSIAHDRTMVLLLMVLAPAGAGHVHGHGAADHHLDADLPAGGQGLAADPVHFGVILILSCGIGLLTPPVGSVLFIGSAIGKIDVAKAVKRAVAILHRHAGRAAGGRAVPDAVADAPGLGQVILTRRLALAGRCSRWAGARRVA